VNQAFTIKCHCGKEVLKIRIGDNWYTMCDICYRNSHPNLVKMSHDQIASSVQLLRSLIGETNPMAKSFIDDMLTEEVCRRL
jgi:hypothetical protein